MFAMFVAAKTVAIFDAVFFVGGGLVGYFYGLYLYKKAEAAKDAATAAVASEAKAVKSAVEGTVSKVEDKINKAL